MVVAVVIPIRGVIMPYVFVARTVPVALIILLAIMMRSHPDSAFIRRAAPVAAMPLIMASNRVPITFHIRVADSRASVPNLNSERRRRPDVNPDTELPKHRHAGQQQQSKQFLFHFFYLRSGLLT
jgi:hypothetical protein